MADTVTEVKEKLNFVEFLRGYIKLIPAGRNFKALCPFHKEKTPSFSISPDRQMWYCFGCSQGGDAFKFLMQYENIEFFEALKILAEKTGVQMSVMAAGGDANKQIYEINRLAKDFFRTQLHETQSAYHAAAKQYIDSRGLSAETIQTFEIGLAPTTNDVLFRFLVAQKKTVQDIEKSGLAIRSERGTYWDRFRSRMMFPLYNQFGKVVGFTGRILPLPGIQTENVGKYVNSPETSIFSKSKILYGLHQTKNAIRDTRTAIVVEGQMDFLMMWQDGIKNVVASSGTALTTEQLTMLRRLADTIILSFDTDAAGQAAAERSIDLAAAQDFTVKILNTGEYKDAADVVKAAPGKMVEFVAAAKTAMEFYFERYPVTGIDRAAQKKNIRVILEKIRAVASPVDRANALRDLAMRAELREEVLEAEMAALPKVATPTTIAQSIASTASKAAEPQTRVDRIAERLIAIVLEKPEKKAEAEAALVALGGIYAVLIRSIQDGKFIEVPSELASVADRIAVGAVFAGAENIVGREKEFARLVEELRVEYLKVERERLRRAIARAEQSGDEVGLEELLKKFDGVVKELHTMS